MPGLGDGVGDIGVLPRQARDFVVGGGLVGLDHRSVVGALVVDQPVEVVLDGV